jgi:hypothetical protein
LARSTKVPHANGDQRSHRRHPVTLELEYKLFKRGRVVQLGSGRTLNVSSGGVLFEANEALALDGLIELIISWPAFLEGICPLKLVMRGRVVRNDDSNQVAISVTHHEFRTARRQNARIAQRTGVGSEMTEGRPPQISGTG